MCLIGYLTSMTLELRIAGSAGVDSLGIRWSGAVARDKVPAPDGNAGVRLVLSAKGRSETCPTTARGRSETCPTAARGRSETCLTEVRR
jgi:hypothetical protein